MNFNFGEVLTRAWQVIWKHKILWVFGILASCSQGGGGGGGGGGDGGGSGAGPDLPPRVMQWFQWIADNLALFFVLFCAVILLIALVAIAIGVIGKIGLIRGTAQAEGGAESLILGQLFSESMPYFGRMFGLSLILTIPVLIVAMLAAALGFTAFMAGGGDPRTALGFAGLAPLALCCLCLFVPVIIVLGMIFRQAERAVVLEDMGVMPALSNGWEVFRKNLGVIILMTIILGVIGVAVGFLFAIPIFIIVFPAALAFAIGDAQNSTPLIFAAVCFCLYLPVLVLLQGVLTAYTESAWTLTYMRLTRKPDSGGDNPMPASAPPLEPDDGNKTVIATRSNA